MTRISKLGLCSLAVGALVLMGTPAQAQELDGASVFKKKGCDACHNIAKAGEEPHRRPGGKQAGPDLAGVTQRRDREWLTRFLKDTDEMIASDPVAIAMVKQAKGLKMPNMKLTDAEIEALLNYLATKPGI